MIDRNTDQTALGEAILNLAKRTGQSASKCADLISTTNSESLVALPSRYEIVVSNGNGASQ